MCIRDRASPRHRRAQQGVRPPDGNREQRGIGERGGEGCGETAVRRVRARRGHHEQVEGLSLIHISSLLWLAQANILGSAVAAGTPIGPEAREAAFGGAAIESALADVQERAVWYCDLYPLVSERLTRLDEVTDKLAFMFWGGNVQLDEKSVNKVLKKEMCIRDRSFPSAGIPETP